MNRKQNSLMRFSKTERLAQLSEQEIVIERKKREIQAKLEARRKKESEEALKKLEFSKESSIKPESSSKTTKTTYSGETHKEEKDISSEPQKKESLTNAFSNDGSFLDQFKKLSQSGLSPQNVTASTFLTNKKNDVEKKVIDNSSDTRLSSETANNNSQSNQSNDEKPTSSSKESNTVSNQDCFLPSQTQVTQQENTSKEESFEKFKGYERRKRKSRWGDAESTSSSSNPETGHSFSLQPPNSKHKELPTPKTTLLSQLTRSDPGLIQYAKQTFGSTDLSEEDWKKAEDHYKINLLYQDMVKKRAEVDKLEKAGKFKYEYDSDEDTEGGTWEHKLRQQEMMATQLWAEELTRQAAGKHHIGDFLPPEELERFMERYNAVKEGREPDLSDYKEYKLKEDNVGYRLLQKMGWNEGQGLGQSGSGITNPVNKATTRHENQGLGVERPDGLGPGDDEYDAYRKRMMLAYRFRPNPLNNPRRPYY